jgi:hypothetical protein
MWNFGPRCFTSSVTLDNWISFVWIFKNEKELVLLHYATGLLSLVEKGRSERSWREGGKELRFSISLITFLSVTKLLKSYHNFGKLFINKGNIYLTTEQLNVRVDVSRENNTLHSIIITGGTSTTISPHSKIWLLCV